MARALNRWLDGRLRMRAARIWARIAGRAGRIPRADARVLRDEARALQRDLRRFLRATSPRAQAAHDNLAALPLPAGTDWRWRPSLLTARTWRLGLAGPANGARLGQEMRVWHDAGTCPPAILRQVPNHGATDLAPFGLMIEIMEFSASYLSLSFDLPQAAMNGLSRSHVVRLELHLRAEFAQNMRARLNIQNGPNADVISAPVYVHVGDPAASIAEFDLSQTAMNPGRLEKLWLDLLIEFPRMNAIVVRDMIVSRHPRVQI